MAKGKTTIVSMTGFVEYAKVFPENLDTGDFYEKTQGAYITNFYPEDDEGFKAFFDAGAPVASLGHDTIKIGNSAIASGKYLKLKRPHVHTTVPEWGGAPAVFDHTQGESLKKWSFADDGELGHGTKVTVKVSVWVDGKKSIQRLEKMAVLKHVEYDGSATGSAIDMDSF